MGTVLYTEGGNVGNSGDTSGKVGIGTSTPSYPLHVRSADLGDLAGFTAGNYVRLTIGADGTYTDITSVNGNHLRLLDESGNSLILRTGGNVGIGTTAPGSKLQVNGNAAIGYSAETTAPTNGLTVNGNVGIGTTTPSAKFDTVGADGIDNSGTGSQNGGAAPDTLEISGGTGGDGTSSTDQGHGAKGGKIYIKSGTGGNGQGPNQSYGGDAGDFDLLGGNGGSGTATGGVNQSSGGGVGGTINVTGGTGGNASSSTGLGYPGNGGSIVLNGGAKGTGTAQSATDGNVILANLRGSVGIGTTSPSSKLDVAGDVEVGSTDAFYLGDRTTTGSWRIFRQNGGNDLYLQRYNGTSWITKQTISGS